MYSDLFEQLGGGGAGSSGMGSRGRAAEAENRGPPPLVSFKAGKMDLAPTENGTFKCEASTTRGEVRLVWKDGKLQWQWYDRREKKVKDTLDVVESGSTFERVELAGKQHKDDRIYVWTRNYVSGDAMKKEKYDMYWMQSADAGSEDEIVAQVNQYLADPASAGPKAMDTQDNHAQVDALSSILENLGMPQNNGGEASGAGASSSGGTLTLADLQGAMASVQQQQQRGPPLAEIVTPGAITALLEDKAVCERLLQFLPSEQRDTDHLEENLRSPQVQQTLRSLTSALLPDDTGSLDGFYSVIANFSLDPADGQEAMAANNPIQAFLDCVLKAAEKEKEKQDDDDQK